MHFSLQSGLVLASIAAPLASAERVLGAYIFARHGDRTPKIMGDTRLTDLGYAQVFDTGSFYHDRYIDSSSAKHIQGISPNLVNLKQVQVSSPEDAVIQNSGTGFLQGLYPPVGSTLNTETLANGTTVSTPLDGYQLIPQSTVNFGAGSENSNWLQSTNGCPKAVVSSNNYFISDQYNELLSKTKDFYESLAPVLSGEFNESSRSYFNAFTIWDYLNVAEIHNSTADFPHKNLLTKEVLHQLLVLANAHEYGLAYNASEPVRAIAGAVLAGDILESLNNTVHSEGELLGLQFGSYGTFLSFFGLMQLPAASVDFTGMPTYASSMVFELVTNATGSGVPDESEISVRFTFHNGTIDGSTGGPSVYPLFGRSDELISWPDFLSETKKVAVLSDTDFCEECGSCPANSTSTSITSDQSCPNSNGIKPAVNGVIGAFVTLGVIMILEAAFFLIGGFTIVRRRRSGASVESPVPATSENKKYFVNSLTS